MGWMQFFQCQDFASFLHTLIIVLFTFISISPFFPDHHRPAIEFLYVCLFLKSNLSVYLPRVISVILDVVHATSVWLIIVTRRQATMDPFKTSYDDEKDRSQRVYTYITCRVGGTASSLQSEFISGTCAQNDPRIYHRRYELDHVVLKH